MKYSVAQDWSEKEPSQSHLYLHIRICININTFITELNSVRQTKYYQIEALHLQLSPLCDSLVQVVLK